MRGQQARYRKTSDAASSLRHAAAHTQALVPGASIAPVPAGAAARAQEAAFPAFCVLIRAALKYAAHEALPERMQASVPRVASTQPWLGRCPAWPDGCGQRGARVAAARCVSQESATYPPGKRTAGASALLHGGSTRAGSEPPTARVRAASDGGHAFCFDSRGNSRRFAWAVKPAMSAAGLVRDLRGTQRRQPAGGSIASTLTASRSAGHGVALADLVLNNSLL